MCEIGFLHLGFIWFWFWTVPASAQVLVPHSCWEPPTVQASISPAQVQVSVCYLLLIPFDLCGSHGQPPTTDTGLTLGCGPHLPRHPWEPSSSLKAGGEVGRRPIRALQLLSRKWRQAWLCPGPSCLITESSLRVFAPRKGGAGTEHPSTVGSETEASSRSMLVLEELEFQEPQGPCLGCLLILSTG